VSIVFVQILLLKLIEMHHSVGTAVEHHTLYQYQLANTQNVYLGFIQTETP
jgi:hypothetical protein